MKLRHSLILLTVLLGLAAHAIAQEPVDELARLRKADKLGEWLSLRMSYAADDPGSRINFLMNTQEEAWRQPSTKEEKESWLHLLLNQGFYLLYNGNIVSSIESYERANRYYAQHALSGVDVAEYLFKPLGNNYTRLGDYSSALYIQQNGLKYALDNKDRLQAASFYNNLAISYRWLGDLDKAEEMAVAGLKMADPGSGTYGLLRSTLGDIQFEKGNPAAAEKTVSEAIATLSKSTSSREQYWLLSAYTLAGQIHTEKNEFAKGLDFFRKGLQLIKDKFGDDRRREKANLLNKIGNIYLSLRQPDRALGYFNESLSVLIPGFKADSKTPLPVARLFPENRLFDALEGRGLAFLALGNKDRALTEILLALESGEKSRAIISSETDKIRYQKSYNRLLESGLEIAYDLWKQSNSSTHAATISQLVEQSKARVLQDEIAKNQFRSSLYQNDSLFKKRLLLQQAIIGYETELINLKGDREMLERNKNEAAYALSQLEKEISARYPALQTQNLQKNISADAVLKSIPKNVAVFNYFLGEETGYNVVIAGGAIKTIHRLTNAKRWKEKTENYLTRYFRKGPSQMMHNPREFFDESQELYEFLIPQWPRESFDLLLIIPDNVIGYLPFESLITEARFSENIRTWPFLIRKTPVSYAYSLRSQLISKNEDGRTGFSGFFITRGASNRVELPAARAEQNLLSSEIKGQFYIDGDADVPHLTRALDNSNVLHISTHSFPFGKDATPALEMADSNYFLFRLNALQRVPDLIVMSACRTGDGLLASGEGILSLSRGFTAAGTNGTVAGLWNVNDKASAEQMHTFYQFLIKYKRPDMALHLTKIDWLEQPHSDPALLLPYYWASMIYTGKMQEVVLQQRSFVNKHGRLLLAAGGLMVIFFIFIAVRIRKRK